MLNRPDTALIILVSLFIHIHTFVLSTCVIIAGNEARHISLKNVTAASSVEAAAAVPPPTNYTYTNITTVDGNIISFVECDSPPSPTLDGETLLQRSSKLMFN